MAPQNMKPRYFKQTGTMPAQIHTRSQMCQKKTRQPGVTARYSEMVCPNSVRGMDHLKDPRLNKGLAFTLEERQALGIHGLLASQVLTQKEQVEICRLSVERYKRDLNKYLYLSELQDTNERLFFSLLDQDIEKYLPIVYTPVVGLACQRFGLTYRRPRGLFITINDKDHIFKVLNNWPENDVRAICFTDGERVLGLGDLGAYGMGIPVGKLSLYTALAGIKPHQCLPILLDVGTENTSLLEDPLYIGIRQKRVRGQQYDDFIEEFMTSCVHRFGRNVLLQFEDFAWNNATRLLNKYKDNYCTFNDDIQGTAGAAVAGFLAATRISKKKISENVVMFFGAGSAACGIGNLTVAAMVEEGLSKKEALERVFLFDLDGLLTSQRPKGVPNHAKNFERDLPPENDFMKCLTTYKPTCLIGCSTVGGAFTPEILKQMSQNAERPIIFALSNPTPQAECTAQAAYDNTEGRCIFASGSPFPPVNYNGKEYRTGQGNNSYIFPGLALGVIATRAYCIPDALFLIAARSLANQVSPEDLEAGRIYPPLSDLKKLSFDLAMEVAKSAYETDIATRYPIPQNFEAFIKKKIYDLNYPSYLPEFYKYPVPPEIKVKSVEEVHRAILRRHDKRKRIKGLWIVFSMIVFILHSLQNIGEVNRIFIIIFFSFYYFIRNSFSCLRCLLP